MKDFVDVFKNLKKHILAGVSYLIPVVVVGGIFCGIGVALGGTAPWEAPGTAGYFFFMLGKVGLNLMPAVIGAFVANSIADKGAVGPGLLLGQVAQDCGAGFLGGILGGIFAGIVVLYMKKVRVYKNFAALWSIIVIPVVAVCIGAFLMQNVVGTAIVSFTNWLTTFFEGLGTGNMIIVAVLIGFFGSIDLGLFGNKAITAIPLAMLSTIDPATGMPVMIAQQLLLIGCTTCAIPPLVCCVASLVAPKKFTPAERESGKAAGFLGLFAITEGAIPLALSDKITYAGCILGSIVGCVAVAIAGPGSIVNWGGLPNLAGNTDPIVTLVCWAIGIVVGVAFVCVFKKAPVEGETKDDSKEATVTQDGEEFNLDL